MSRIRAPFTDEQIAALKAWQTSDEVHSYTCGECGTDLVIMREYMICVLCGYKQYWAHGDDD